MSHLEVSPSREIDKPCERSTLSLKPRPYVTMFPKRGISGNSKGTNAVSKQSNGYTNFYLTYSILCMLSVMLSVLNKATKNMPPVSKQENQQHNIYMVQ